VVGNLPVPKRGDNTEFSKKGGGDWDVAIRGRKWGVPDRIIKNRKKMERRGKRGVYNN